MRSIAATPAGGRRGAVCIPAWRSRSRGGKHDPLVRTRHSVRHDPARAGRGAGLVCATRQQEETIVMCPSCKSATTIISNLITKDHIKVCSKWKAEQELKKAARKIPSSILDAYVKKKDRT